ncbi:MAG: CBS and ACT domain-containing protein [Caldicoprobacter sp.]|uniref:CBS and ACT domain-containing protein n=1 Tax=Caldicoprobacter sp. TaxID=2004500 RepID=UPI001D84B1E6|nr:transcriptional regulator [Clostridia bacterium]
MFVKNRMTTNPFTISPDQTVPDAQELMMKHGIRRLPVVKDGKLVGVVTKEDIERYSPSKATSLSMGEIIYLLSKTKIKQIMTKDVVTISPNALLEEAATLMRDQKVGFLPVVDGDKLVGIITESDIFDAFIELLGFREKGTRLTIEASDEPGILARLTGIFAQYGANITRVAVFRGADGTSSVVVGINSFNTADIEKTLEENGFKILYKLQNE